MIINKDNKKIEQKLNLLNNSYSLIRLLYKYLKNIKIINNELIISLKDNKALLIVINILNKHYKYQFKEVVDICTTDYLRPTNRFEVNYALLSLKYKFRLRIKLYVNENEYISSIVGLYSGANWLERENWDMFGIYFTNHPDLRRILTDYGFEGFPFRKDFPLSGYIELRYDDEDRVVVYENLEITQEFRYFDFASPWGWQSNWEEHLAEKQNNNK